MQNILRLSFVLLALMTVMAFDVQFCLAGEVGNYPGKWYGWWNPLMPKVPEVPWGEIPEWENQKIIKSWGYETGNSFEEIKDLIPGEAFYEVCLMHPEGAWGDFRINETAYLRWDFKEWWEATEKYKGTAHVDEEGQLQNFKAGCPFPGTKNPIEMAWNIVKRHDNGDNFWGPYMMYVMDRKGQTRWIVGENDILKFDGRLEMDPKPFLTPNPHNYDFLHTFGYKEPYDMRGTVPLVYRYNDPRPDDMWMYLPALRRVRRMSASQRWDKVPGGGDVWWDSFVMFWGKPTNYNWKYLGQKMIFGGHNASTQQQMMKGKLLNGCDQYWQRINCEILEATPKITSPVSRFVMYLDPDVYTPLWGIYYDKRGREWCVYVYPYGMDKKWGMLTTNMIMVDVQRHHSTGTFANGMIKNQDFINPAFFKMDYLKKWFGGR